MCTYMSISVYMCVYCTYVFAHIYVYIRIIYETEDISKEEVDNVISFKSL